VSGVATSTAVVGTKFRTSDWNLAKANDQSSSLPSAPTRPGQDPQIHHVEYLVSEAG
jgi:hypothetical protein